mmetsp:Transcript_6250/g.9181  ORF Transcript_6250/g.9181 Transcript_6250/m.9181 type:complete len:200 (-) Transcript_6250:76-675(-)
MSESGFPPQLHLVGSSICLRNRGSGTICILKRNRLGHNLRLGGQFKLTLLGRVRLCSHTNGFLLSTFFFSSFIRCGHAINVGLALRIRVFSECFARTGLVVASVFILIRRLETLLVSRLVISNASISGTIILRILALCCHFHKTKLLTAGVHIRNGDVLLICKFKRFDSRTSACGTFLASECEVVRTDGCEEECGCGDG